MSNIDKILELEAENYETARNIDIPENIKPTQIGHQMETIEIEVKPSFATDIRSIFGYNAERIGAFVEEAVQERLSRSGLAHA